MLSKNKRLKLITALKTYNSKFLRNKISELDESGTRLMINSFLTDILGYAPIEEVKTEYMIRGTYADYVIQVKGVRHFLVEVKSLSLQLSDKHLRQATNYGANEGIEFVLLTNGKDFNFYKIIFGKPIEVRKIFSLDISDNKNLKNNLEFLEFLHKDSVSRKGLDLLWNKTKALDPEYIAGLLYDQKVFNLIRKHLKNKFNAKFTDEEISHSISRIIFEAIPVEKIKSVKTKKRRNKKSTMDLKMNDTNTTSSSGLLSGKPE
jgi:hypothetical protein